MRSQLKNVTIEAAALLLALWVNNSSRIQGSSGRRPWVLAHRGVMQQFALAGVTNDTCTATRIYPPHHTFLEDTIPSMRQAFADGADVVEFDIHPTTDGQWAVFHDWTLDCRTDGHGVTREHTMPELKRLDVGYGYTADGGRTFPLRGHGVGLMPSLDEVLNAFPSGRFLIHIKSNDPREGSAFARKLNTLPSSNLQRLMIHGGNRPLAVVRSQVPTLETMSPEKEKGCVIAYLGLGWSGYVPKACRNSVLLIPENYASLLWGWPNKFLARMDRVHTTIFLMDKLTSEDRKAGRTQGLNTKESLAEIPPGYSGAIWTDAIETMGPAIRARR